MRDEVLEVNASEQAFEELQVEQEHDEQKASTEDHVPLVGTDPDNFQFCFQLPFAHDSHVQQHYVDVTRKIVGDSRGPLTWNSVIRGPHSTSKRRADSGTCPVCDSDISKAQPTEAVSSAVPTVQGEAVVTPTQEVYAPPC